jgi:protein-tyrosine phosphatase
MKPEVYWIRDIDPLRLAMMARPRGGEWLEDEVSGWKEMDIHSVVSLLHPYEADELGISAEERLCANQGILFRSFPIKDRSTPELEQDFLRLADDVVTLVTAGSSVAIHCRAGIGRSGLLAGVVLHRLGVPVQQVFSVLSRARGLAVPDTPAQAEWFQSVAARMRSNNSLESDAFKATRASS